MEKYYDIKKIDDYIKKNNLTKTKFCKLCGIGYKTLQNIYADNPYLNLRAILKVIKVLKCNIIMF